MDQLPGFTQWPVFKEILFIFSEVLNFIFDSFANAGVINITLSVIFFSLIYQLLLLPFNIQRGLKASKTNEQKAALKLLEGEYKDKMDNPVLFAEYKEKREKILEKKKQKKGVGCLVFFIQFFIMLCMLNVLAYMNFYVRVLSSLDDGALTNAYSLFGLDLRISAKQDWWPAVLLIILYIAIFFLPNAIKQHLANKRIEKQWLDEISEEEKAIVESENKKKDKLSVIMIITKLISPALVFYLSISVPCYFVIYWIANAVWKMTLFHVAKFLYRKAWPAMKKMWQIIFGKKCERGA